MKNYHMDLVRVTEAGAVAAAEWVGRGDKESADLAATDAMRTRLNKIDFSAEIAIGEGKKDKSFGLFEGEVVGCLYPNPTDPANKIGYSIAVDPIEGTSPTAKGGYEAMSVIALGQHGCFFKTEHFYMKKLAVGPRVAHKFRLDLRGSVEHNIACVAAALDKAIKHVTVCILDRPRHADLIGSLRELGCRIKLISDCDVTACIATCVPDSDVDIYLSVGGAPEAVISAAAMKCIGGYFQAQLADADGNLVDEKIYEINDLVAGDAMFCGTGITDGKLLKGVQFTSDGPVTHSIAMRSESGTTRRIVTYHGN